MKCYVSLLCLLLIGSNTYLWGQSTLSKIEINGKVGIDYFAYFEEEEGSINERNQVKAQFRLKPSKAEHVRYLVDAEYRGDAADPSRSWFLVREAYLEYTTKYFDIRAGKSIVKWATADAFNVVDFLSPKDYSDFIDIEDMGILNLGAKLYLNDVKISAHVFPDPMLHFLPDPASRWTVPGAPMTYDPETNRLIHQKFQYMESRLPESRMDKMQYALKVEYQWKGWDLAIGYYHGMNRIAWNHIDSRKIGRDTLLLSVTPYYHGWDMLSFEFATALGSVGLRGEGAYFSNFAYDGQEIAKGNLDDPYFQYIIGLDKTMANIVGENNLQLIFQWHHEITKGGYDPPANSILHYLRESVILDAKLALGVDKSMSLRGVYSTNKDSLIEGEFNWKPEEGLGITLSSTFIDGRAETFFGQYTNNDRVRLQIEYSF